jgi:hypothetical protein
MNFVEYITSLAPEGETALLVQQKAIMRDGVQKTHGDGTLAYTWPAYLPGRKTDGAWYLNTGCFMLDRFRDGKPSASSANAAFVLCMMLDDVGTEKAPNTPPLPPTWVMETSPGSFQWGYAFSAQPTTGDYTAAIKAIAAAGYTDPGATNAVRNFRIPGSINLKPGRDSFASRLVEFHPDREYSLPEICEALGVTPDEADTASHKALRLADTGADTVLQWMNEHGLVLSRTNAEGWCGVVCPNHAAHTDGQIEARYRPLDRSFCCYHGHCEDLNSTAFLDWVFEQGGPRVQHGLRNELLAERMAKVRERLTPTDEFPDAAAARVAEVDRAEMGRIERAAWYERFAYIMADNGYFDLDTRRDLTRANFDAQFRHIACKSIRSGRNIEASVAFDENRQGGGGRTLQGLTYAPGETALVYRSGDVYGNTWLNARPAVVGAAGDVSPWLDHVEALIPEAVEREHVLDVLAFKVQNPKVKVNHAILHGGDEGIGKDTLYAPFIWAVCGPDLKNYGLVDGKKLDSDFDYHYQSEVVVLNELRETDASARRALANKLKPIIAAPPDVISINRKNRAPYDLVNRLLVLAFTNDYVPLTLPSQDRRWFAVWSTVGRLSAEASVKLWNWYKAGGFEACAAWLYARDVAAFNPAAAPPVTDWKRNLVESSMSAAEGYLLDMMQTRRGEFAKGVVGGPWHAVCSRLAALAPAGTFIAPNTLFHALKEAGWKDLGRVSAPELPTKKHLFVAPDMARMSKSDLRRMVEPPAPPTLSVVKGSGNV